MLVGLQALRCYKSQANQALSRAFINYWRTIKLLRVGAYERLVRNPILPGMNAPKLNPIKRE